MPLRKTLTLVVAAVLMVSLAGCKKKKPNVPQAQTQAPTISETQPEAAAPAPVEAQPETKSEPAKTEPTPPATTTASKPTAARPRHPRTNNTTAKKPAAPQPTQQATTQLPQTIPTPAPAPAPPPTTQTQPAPAPSEGIQIAPRIPHDEALHQRMTTEQLLQSTEQNLRSLTRTLSAQEGATVQQIRNFMQQSRQATVDGDLPRAGNLALKAHLLSDDLIRR